MFAKSSFFSAALVFQRNSLIKFSTTKSSIKLNSTMKTLISSNHHEKALDLFEKQSRHRTDRSYTLALKAATKLKDFQRGIEIHRQIKQQFLTDPFIQTSLIHLYMQCSRVEQANQIFAQSSQKTEFMYGAMMKGYMTNNMPEKVIEIYKQIQIEPDEVLLTLLFNACAQVLTKDSIQLGQDLIRTLPPSLFKHRKLMNSSIDMLMKFNDVEKAEQFFDKTPEKDQSTYVAMINGYFLNNLSEKALNLFNRIRSKSNEFLYSTMFNGLASMNTDEALMTGQQILHQMPKKYQNDIVVNNSVIKMYMKFNRIQEAEEFFFKLNSRNIQTYGLMMQGYNENNLPEKTLALFKTIRGQSIEINPIIALLLIRACASIGIKSISQSVLQEISHIKFNLTLQNALIDLWAKSGDIEQAKRVFESINEPDVVSYNCLINGYGRNGMGAEAIDCYKMMPSYIRDNISHICVLNACSHSGLLEQARTIYRDLENKTSDITSTMVDCLSRMALFDQAQSLIDEYEKLHKPSLVMYTALLSGARNHRQAIISQKIYDRMKTLFSDKKSDMISASILLSNTYASIGDQHKANHLRSDRIKEFGKKVQVGSSWTEVDGQLFTFIAHDRSHPRSDEIYAELERLSNELKENGHSFDSSWITRPLEDGETVESALCGHSERLAIAFNFIQNRKPSFIQITKNLRVCGDCHSATKLIARIRHCEIVVRDSNRIHHFFPNGQCSCRDHF